MTMTHDVHADNFPFSTCVSPVVAVADVAAADDDDSIWTDVSHTCILLNTVERNVTNMTQRARTTPHESQHCVQSLATTK